MKKIILFLLSIIILHSCSDKNETNLTDDDLVYINSLIPLDNGEEIEFFESNSGISGLEMSGNFITNVRLANYWIDGKDDEINSIKYSDIDSIQTNDLVKVTTYASYLKVYGRDQTSFKVYVDADSTRTWQFFNKALQNWESQK